MSVCSLTDRRDPGRAIGEPFTGIIRARGVVGSVCVADRCIIFAFVSLNTMRWNGFFLLKIWWMNRKGLCRIIGIK